MSKLLPYETILKAREGDPEAVNAVLLHYDRYIRYFSKVNGQVNAEVEDYVKLLWSSFFVTLVAKKYRLATMLPFVPRMVCDSR